MECVEFSESRRFQGAIARLDRTPRKKVGPVASWGAKVHFGAPKMGIWIFTSVISAVR